MDAKIIGGVFSKVNHAESAISELQHLGYDSKDISIFAKEEEKVNRLEDEKEKSISSNEDEIADGAGSATGLGAIAGRSLGGIGGLLTNIGLISVPGGGNLTSAGPIAFNSEGRKDGVSRSLQDSGVPAEEAQKYEDEVENGKIIVLVEAIGNMQDDVHRIFRTNHTENKSMYPDHY
ncbi:MULTISPECIES: general stress protein [Pontibacillus]|uniref:General stress protein n=1 Tax=Pontibacillus chungwhensis TaxID=265426 RepID=A0ABY8UYG6_9BACI|nr:MULTISPECIES: general stress protein [Pontibacillus]MCD5325978.1 general stress protein [Pontibacillus sp. HN14]WIF98433.1 general stress protein [Pontibacillus chungwhensis]